MTQVVVMKTQTPDQSYVLIESEAKNPLPSNSNLTWNDLAGLSWLIIENNDNCEFQS